MKIIRATLLVIAIYTIYQVGINLWNILFDNSISFGYDNTIEWEVLTLVFWFSWIVGGTGFLFNKNWSFSLLLPISFVSIILSLVSINKASYAPMGENIINIVGLTASLAIFVFLNTKSYRVESNIRKWDYLFGFLYLTVIVVSFFIIDQKQFPH